MNIKNDDVILKDSKIQDKFKHAKEFGVTGKRCRENFNFFKERIIDHMIDPSTITIEGTYKRIIKVIKSRYIFKCNDKERE